MPIRFEHGPNLAPVGQVAYQTGQLEYRNKRRTELERLAMQQAEMRQRAQMQQQQIAASLQGQKMSHMNAMQRLAVGQQFGQVNAQQANQWNVQAAEQKREHDMGLAEQVGQRAVDRVKFAQGLADEADWKKAEWNWLVKTYDTGLNAGGKQNMQGLLTDRFKLMYDKKLNEQQRNDALEQNMGQLQEARTDPRWKLGLDQEIGYTEEWGERDDGNFTWTRTRIGHGKGDDDWATKPNLIRMIADPQHMGPEPAPMIRTTISPAQWSTENTSYFDIDGRPHKTAPDPDNPGRFITTEVDTSKADSAAEAKREERSENAIQWDIDERDKWRDYNGRQQLPGNRIELAQWMEQAGDNPYRDTPALQQFRQGTAPPVGVPGLGGNPFAGDPAPQAPQAPVAPQAPAPAQAGMPGLGGEGFEGGFPADMPPEQQAQMEEHARAVERLGPQPVAPPDLNAPAGAEGAEPVVLNAEEAMQMVQAGQLAEGTIVQLPSGKKIPAGQQADPNDIPLMMRAQ